MITVYTLAAISLLLWGHRTITLRKESKRKEYVMCLLVTSALLLFWALYLGLMEIDKTSAIIAAAVFIIYYFIFRKD